MTHLHYSIPADTAEHTLEIKRSEFIAYCGLASDREQAESFIRNIRQLHPQARHVCWAYIAGAPNTTITSMSDDGEPSGTAGRPMLNVLQYSGLGQIVVAVVRYFGGIKLGTGGLQRAYSEAVSSVLAQLPTNPYVPRNSIVVEIDYNLESSIRRLSEQFDCLILECHYRHNVSLHLSLATHQIEEFSHKATNLSGGTISLQKP